MNYCRALALVALAGLAVPARAEHANIDLRVMQTNPQTGAIEQEMSSTADREPPAGGLMPRPLLKVKADEPLALQFVLTNTYPHGVKKNVKVSYFVVREQKRGQKTVPALTKGVVTQGSFTMNFKPKCRVGARVEFKVKQPGLYLVRVQTDNTDSDHEHFSAIDLQVK